MTKSVAPVNPFYTGISIPDEFFCDRKVETERIVKLIQNGNNIVLKAPRRIGKSSLVKHVFLQPEISKVYNTLYVDVFGTKNASDFINELQNGLLAAPFAKGEKGRREVLAALMGTSVGSVKVGFSDEGHLRLSLREIFSFLEKTKRPNLIVFDEFQQIQYYPERMAAILRSHIQQMNNSRFIFSGSSRHILNSMFESLNEPFYKSASAFDLDIISLDSYVDFCRTMFERFGKGIDPDAVRKIYYLFVGNTYDMQQVMRGVFASTPSGAEAGFNDALKVVDEILTERDNDFRSILNRLDNKKERNTLFCVAAEGLATGLTSNSMMKKYDLDNASSVQNAIRNLCDEKQNLVVKLNRSYYKLQDKFMELWYAKKCGFFEAKISNARILFEKERELISS